MKEKISAGKNLIYCSTFQIAWNELIDGIIKGPLQLAGNPLTAQVLNERLTGKQDVSENCYVAMAGFNKDGIIDKIKKALKDKFNTTPGIDISLERPNDILAYAFLFKDLKFDPEFESLKDPILFNGKTPVKAFGIEEYSSHQPAHVKLGEKVEILYYLDDNNFIIRLKSASPNDEIILAKITPQGALLETIKYVFNHTGNPSALSDEETLQIPKFDFDILHHYSELEGKFSLNKGFEDYFVKKAIQSIKFKLNEKGALLKSEAGMGMKLLAMRVKRRFVFDRPFLICLREKGARYPYFVMWVENDELLLRAWIESDKLLLRTQG